MVDISPLDRRRAGLGASVAVFATCALIAAAVIWLGARQPRGLTNLATADLDYAQRLWPIGCLTLLACCAALAFARVKAPGDRHAAPRVAAVVLLGFVLSLLGVWLLRGFGSSSDEYVHLFQSWTLLAGRLWNPLPDGVEFLHFSHVFAKDGKWVGQYAPGWALMLALIQAIGLPAWFAGPLSGLVLLWATARLAARAAGPEAGWVAALLLAVSPFFVFNAASFFNHVPAAAMIALFCLFAGDYMDRPTAMRGLLAGAMAGLLGLTRSADVPIVALPFAVVFLRRAGWPHWRRLPWFLPGALPFLAALLLYNRAITGDALLPPTAWGYPLLHLGLYGTTEWGATSSPLLNLRMLLARLVDLSDWTSPVLLFGAPAAFAWLWRVGRLRFHDWVFPILVATFFFYPDIGGDQYGPRYYFEGYPLLLVSLVAAGLDVARRLDDLWRRALIGIALAHVAICLAGLAVIGPLMRVVADQRMDVHDLVARAGLRDAVVVLRDWTGGLRPMTPDGLTRNGIAADGPVIYVLDLPGRLDELKTLFPGRRRYVYLRPEGAVTGALVPLD